MSKVLRPLGVEVVCEGLGVWLEHLGYGLRSGNSEWVGPKPSSGPGPGQGRIWCHDEHRLRTVDEAEDCYPREVQVGSRGLDLGAPGCNQDTHGCWGSSFGLVGKPWEPQRPPCEIFSVSGLCVLLGSVLGGGSHAPLMTGVSTGRTFVSLPTSLGFWKL